MILNVDVDFFLNDHTILLKVEGCIAHLNYYRVKDIFSLIEIPEIEFLSGVTCF